MKASRRRSPPGSAHPGTLVRITTTVTAPRGSGDPRRPGGVRRLRGRGSGLFGLLRFLVFAVLLGGFVLVVALTALRPLVAGALVGWAYDNPGAQRIPFVADLVRENLGAALTTPASDDPADVTFTVERQAPSPAGRR